MAEAIEPRLMLAGLSISDAVVTEGSLSTRTAIFTVSLLHGDDGTVSVDFATADVSATGGSDYQISSGTLIFAGGETTKTIELPVISDISQEANETFLVNLSGAFGATIIDAQAVGTIVDDDASSLAIDDAQILEGNVDTAAAVFTVKRFGSTAGTTTVDFNIIDGSATLAGGDYQGETGTLTFNSGESSQTITVLINGDTNQETNEVFAVNLGAASNATIIDARGIGTIVDDDATFLVIGDTLADEGSGTAGFSVHRLGSTEGTTTVKLDTADDTASADSDYVALSTTLTFNPGETRIQVIVTVNNDALLESRETFLVRLSNASNATIVDAQSTVGIIDDDGPAPATIELFIGKSAIAEDDEGTTDVEFLVARLGPTTGSASVNFATSDGTATADGDYQSISGTVPFAAGEGIKTVTVTVKGDRSPESSENFSLTLSNASGATLGQSSLRFFIIDDDASSFFMNNIAIAERNSGSTEAIFTVNRLGSTRGTATVNFATGDVSATLADDDYHNRSGTLTFAPFETSKTISVLVNGDTAQEENEAFTLTLSSPTNAAIGTLSARCTIVDDDESLLFISDVTVAEPVGTSADAVFTVRRTGSLAESASVLFLTSDGSAVAGEDYQAGSAIVNFGPGESFKTFAVVINSDSISELPENFLVSLSDAVNAVIVNTSATGFIVDPPPPLPKLAIGDVQISEGNSGTANAAFVVTLSSASVDNVTVNFATVAGTASATSGDYQARTGTLVFIPGETSRPINIVVNGDLLVEPDEGFRVQLSGAVHATLLDASGSGVIVNDDAAVTLSIGDVQIIEGNSGTANAVFVVTLSAATSATVTVNFATADDSAVSAAGDYQSNSGTLTFASGETSKTITVAINGDVLVEEDEGFLVQLSTAVNSTLLDASGSSVIGNDDNGVSIISLSVSPDPIVRTGKLRLTANDVADSLGIIRKVEFFVDSDASGAFEPANDKRLGVSRLRAGAGSILTPISRAAHLGEVRYFARALDNRGTFSNVVSAVGTIVNNPPTLPRILALPNRLPPGRSLSLVALGAKDRDGAITRVDYYLDNGDGILQPDTDRLLGSATSPRGRWKITPDVSDLAAGQITILAVATDNDGGASSVVTTVMTLL